MTTPRTRLWFLSAVGAIWLAAATGGCGWGNSDNDPLVTRPASSLERSAAMGLAPAAGENAEPAAALKSEDAAEAWFEDVTPRTGIDFVHVSGTSAEKPFPASNGSGVGALDYDLDGRYDLLFLTGTPFPLDPARREPANGFYRNRGQWRFEDASALSGLDHSGFSAGVAVGDYDSDGFPDVYVACYGPNVLFHNQGDGTYQALPGAGAEDPRWATSAAMLDYDEDGLLDLYVCNYGQWTWETNPFCGDRVRNVRIYCSPLSIPPEPDVLLRNQGDGTFADVTASAGLAARAGRAQGVLATDLNDDGRIDLYVSNDMHANSLFLNQGGGTFRDASESSGVAYDFEGQRQAGMGVAAGDTNGDGLPELLVTNFLDEHNAFYENLGGGLFNDVAAARGLAADSRPWVGWGTCLEDLDLDGWLDLLVTNGHLDDNLHLLGQTTPYASPPLLWRNLRGRFLRVGPSGGTYFQRTHVGRGLAAVDLDNDGDQDVVISHQDAGPAVLRNRRLEMRDTPRADLSAGDQPAGNHPPSPGPASLVVRLIGTRANRDGIGARLTLSAFGNTAPGVAPADPGRSLVRQVIGGGSYLSASDRRQVFAVLPGEQRLTLVVQWPGGGQTRLEDLQAGQSYVLVEPSYSSSLPLRISYPLESPR
ncbi:MAG: CRTAC1 family protein [Pirellulaceae bacterium]|nr:CRTAC1 family protein [Pirellulaceae bacterium]